MRFFLRQRDGERGMALVLVLLVLSVLTAMVVEFAYGIYVNTSLLNNWQRLQEISMAAESGISIGSGFMKLADSKSTYNTYRVLPVPPTDPFDIGIKVGVTVEEENSKLNIDMIIDDFGKNTKYYTALETLLDALDLKKVLAESIRDHIYSMGGGRTHFNSVEELLLVAGIDREVYNTLSPYVTVFGNGEININTAEKPVLMSLSGQMTEEMAQRVIEHRNESPFKANKLNTVPGLEGVMVGLPQLSKGNTFSVTSKAMDEDGLVREIRCVMNNKGLILYWREL